MPVRLVCPSCSATLSVKDEYAGRAVKCPKCGGVIPAPSPSGAAPPTPSKPAMPSLPSPAPPPAKPAFEEVDEPAKPSGPKITGRPTGKPVAKSNSEDLPDEDDRPARRRGRNEDRDDERDADDDRPRRARRDRDDEDDGPRTKKGGSSVAIILGIIGFLLLTCCGGVGVLFWSGWQKVRQDDIAENKGEDPDTPNPATITDPALRVKVGDLLENYRDDPEFAAGKWGGKKYLIEFTFADALEDADGQPVIADDADKGFRRPTVVARLVNRKGFKAGRRATFYIEGTIKGPVPVKDAKWFNKWAELPVSSRAVQGQVLVIEDARIVPEPKK